MATRNYNNTTTAGSLTSPVSPSDVLLSVTGFSGYPSVPFTITLGRSTVSEEVALCTAVNSSTLTVVRGYNQTAAQTHLAGVTVEHTAVALDFAEANAHVNADANVHGVTGGLVGDEAAQTLLDKTLISPVVEADVAAGDAIVAYVPEGAEIRNLFRGMNPAGDDVVLINANGDMTARSAHTTGDAEVDGNHRVDGNLSVGGTSAFTGAVTVPVPTANANPARKDTTDALGTRLTTAEGTLANATSTATANRIAKRDASGRLQVAAPSASADAVPKSTLDAAVATLNAADTAIDGRLDILEYNAGWQTPTLGSGWVAYGLGYTPVRYLKIHGMVEVRGMVKNGTIGTLFTLPAGYRPANTLPFTTIANPNVAARIDVQSDGVVAVISLGSGNNGYLSLNFCFFSDA